MEAAAARGVRHEGVPRRHGVRDGADVHGGSGTDHGALPAKVTGGHPLDSHSSIEISNIVLLLVRSRNEA